MYSSRYCFQVALVIDEAGVCPCAGVTVMAKTMSSANNEEVLNFIVNNIKNQQCQ
ncbi:hypothetical protein SAMN05660479_01168 [Microbulbifer thermotolerans]|nr:hypothetical protein SAMN05660479_01168 [Microbulbifer thermotolerans]